MQLVNAGHEVHISNVPVHHRTRALDDRELPPPPSGLSAAAPLPESRSPDVEGDEVLSLHLQPVYSTKDRCSIMAVLSPAATSGGMCWPSGRVSQDKSPSSLTVTDFLKGRQ